jgi:hypothetical protein
LVIITTPYNRSESLGQPKRNCGIVLAPHFLNYTKFCYVTVEDEVWSISARVRCRTQGVGIHSYVLHDIFLEVGPMSVVCLRYVWKWLSPLLFVEARDGIYIETGDKLVTKAFM